MFTDDTSLFIPDENIGELLQQMRKELKSVSTWFKGNKLFINIDKTKWTIYDPTSKRRFMPKKFPGLFTDDITPERETVTKILGVLIYENNTWKAHISKISIKSSNMNIL